MMLSNTPTMYVFAGNNGSGKSSFRNLIGEQLGIQINIDPDSLGRKYTNHKDMRAGREAITLVTNYIKNKTSFSMETTLSSKLSLRQIKTAKQKGFKIVIYYLSVSEIDINLMRISQRVERGGHDIPTETVLRRSDRTVNNLIKIIDSVDEVYLVDNTAFNASVMATVIVLPRQINFTSGEIPKWINDILDEIVKKHDFTRR